MNSIHLIGNFKKGGATNVAVMWHNFFLQNYPSSFHTLFYCFKSKDDYGLVEKKYLFRAKSLLSLIKGSKNTVLISHTIKPHLISLALSLFSFIKPKSIFVIHNQDAYIKRTGFKFVWFLLYKFSAKICFVSEEAKQFYITTLNCTDQSKLTVIQNGFDYESKLMLSNSFSRLKFLSSNQVPRVGIASRLIPQKNIPLVAEIIQNFSLSNMQLDFNIYGEGPEIQYLYDLIPLDNPNIRIQFHGFESDISNIYRNIDVFLSTSLWEGFPISPIEAILFGCYCVLSPIPQHERLQLFTDNVFIPNSFKAVDFAHEIRSCLNLILKSSKNRLELAHSGKISVLRLNDLFFSQLSNTISSLS